MSTNSSGGAGARLYARLTAQPVLILFLLTFAVVAFLNPAKFGLLLWGLSKLTAFAYCGDWIDRRTFKDKQPEQLTGVEQGTAWKRKGLLIAASIIAGAFVP